MVVSLTGDNAFGWRAELDKLVSSFVAEHGDMAVERLDGAAASFDRIRESLQSLPFLAPRKLVVLREPGAGGQFAEAAESLLEGLPEATDVIIIEPKLDRRSGYYKLLKKVTDFRDFAAVDDQAAARWLAGQAKERGGSISAADARYLVERVGLDQQLLANELDKLLLYNPVITHENIMLLTEPAPQSTIFELIEAAFAGRAGRALALYREQREQKVDPAQVIALLTWQLRVLAIIKAAAGRSADEIARDAKLSPFVVRKSMAVANGLSLSRLKQLIAELLTIDARAKRENIDLDEALQNYLLRMAP